MLPSALLCGPCAVPQHDIDSHSLMWNCCWKRTLLMVAATLLSATLPCCPLVDGVRPRCAMPSFSAGRVVSHRQFWPHALYVAGRCMYSLVDGVRPGCATPSLSVHCIIKPSIRSGHASVSAHVRAGEKELCLGRRRAPPVPVRHAQRFCRSCTISDLTLGQVPTAVPGRLAGCPTAFTPALSKTPLSKQDAPGGAPRTCGCYSARD